MNYYMVFGSIKRPLTGGGSRLDWAIDRQGYPAGPIGVYQADSPQEACQAAAADVAGMGTFFAVEGTPWGLELMGQQAQQFGRQESALEKLTSRLDRMDQLDRQIAELQAARESESDDDE